MGRQFVRVEEGPINLVEVVILLGAQCVSPLESGPGLTEAGKVHCAVLVLQDPQTSEVEFVPPTAATDPAVVAMLARPHGAITVSKVDRLPAVAADDITGSITPAPRIVPASAEVETDAAPKPAVKKKRPAKAAIVRKRVVVGRRSDACGSYRAVWYTNKDGRRKYRCEKAG